MDERVRVCRPCAPRANLHAHVSYDAAMDVVTGSNISGSRSMRIGRYAFGNVGENVHLEQCHAHGETMERHGHVHGGTHGTMSC
eukprot:6728831-Pyramimonas_sp.AAC.1